MESYESFSKTLDLFLGGTLIFLAVLVLIIVPWGVIIIMRRLQGRPQNKKINKIWIVAGIILVITLFLLKFILAGIFSWFA